VGRDVRLTDDGSAVEPERGLLFEDDGPAAGYSYRPNEEILSGEVRIRKDFEIPDPRATSATLLVAPGGALAAEINGKPQALEAPRTTGKYWQAYAVDPALFKRGLNRIVLHGTGKVWIARADEFPPGAEHPDRSARSADGGKTWDSARLGPRGDLDGEYCIRLALDAPRAGGTLSLPVIDAGNLAGRPIGPPLTALGPVKVTAAGAGAVRLRSGPTPLPGPGWVDGDGGGRYLAIVLEVSGPVKGLRIEATPTRPPDWTRELEVSSRRNDPIVRTSITFAVEPYDHPRLKELREKCRLDEVLQGATSEFEVVARLAAWASQLWTDGHLREGYPAWDALEILKPHADGRPVGGFCQQYNLVLLQACESLGIPGRCVSIGPGDHGSPIRGGHEVVELWSNDYRKWVYVDGNAAWCFTDADAATPLSLLELRERQLRGRPVRVVVLAETKVVWKGISDWPPFIELRLIPRSNFLEQPAPLPLNQGMRGWFWTGHVAWSDREAPASPIYGRRVTRRGDFEWTWNTVHLTLEAVGPGELRVHLDTETPGFAAYLVSLDGAAPRPLSSGFPWTLRKGKNAIEVRTRNTAGRQGPPARIEIELRG
jgi:transglutaminase-like putative cysteine protease